MLFIQFAGDTVVASLTTTGEIKYCGCADELWVNCYYM